MPIVRKSKRPSVVITESPCSCSICAGRGKIEAQNGHPSRYPHEIAEEREKWAKRSPMRHLNIYNPDAVEHYREFARIKGAPEHLDRRPPVKVHMEPSDEYKRRKARAKLIPKFETLQERIDWINSRTDIGPGMKKMQIDNAVKRANNDNR